MCSYLDQVGSTYYFRRAVPAELRPYILTRTGQPRSEWKISLATKDRGTAKKLIPGHTIKTDAEMASARRQLADGPSPVRASTEHYALTEEQIEQAEWYGRQSARSDARRAKMDAAIAFLEQQIRGSTQETPASLRPFRAMLREARHDSAVAKSHLAALKAERGASGPVDAVPVPSTLPAPQGKPAVPLLATFDAYATAQGMTAGVAKEWRNNVAALVQFIGHDDATRLSDDHLFRWRDSLLKETIRGGTLRKPLTVKGKYITPVRAMLNWAVEERKLPMNVALNVKVRVPREAKLREREFTAQEAKAVLAASLAPASSNMAVENQRARRWIPWLCAYTGGRVNEYSQLRGEDVTQIEGIWTLRITPEAGAVKGKEARIVPLHPHLIEQGFLDVVAAVGTGPLFYDPTRQRVNSDDNRHFKKVGERLALWVRSTVGIDDPAIKPNHAWRHLFKTLTREHGIAERTADAIQGHKPRSVGQSYGSVPLKTKADAIAQLPRFDVT